MDPFTLNLALTFLTMGPARCELHELEEVLPGLLVLLPIHSGLQALSTPARKAQSHQVAHLINYFVLERMVTDDAPYSRTSSMSSTAPPSALTLAGAKMDSEALTSARFACIDQLRQLLLNRPEIVVQLYELLLDALLYQPSSSKTMPPPGLSQAGQERLLGGTTSTRAKD